MNPRILLVEDDPTTSAYLVALTEMLPAHVDAAASLAEALRHAASNAYDLWLVDANLPDGSGVELLGTLRGRVAWRDPARPGPGGHGFRLQRGRRQRRCR